MKKSLLGIVALCGLVILGAVAFFPGAEDLNSATIAIDGMSCAACAEKITGMLQGLDGVAAAKVDYEKGEAQVKFDAALITLPTMEKEISKLGFGTDNFEAQACDPAQKQCEPKSSASMDCCAPPPKRSDT